GATVADVGSGTIGATTNPHTYAADGSYYVTITVTDAFGSVSQIQGVIRVSDAALGDPGFENPSQGSGNSTYNPSGSAWTFLGGAGLAGNGSSFTAGNPPAPQGAQVAFLQSSGSSISQATT